MAVTIKMISQVSGVSRGTVDRVLNGRGQVKPETEELVRRVADQLGYRPNLAGQALAARKKSFRIAVLLTAEGNPFFSEVIRGIRAAEAELLEYDVSVCLESIKGYDPATQLAALDRVSEGTSAVIFNPVDDPRIAARVEELMEEGVAVATVNTDIGGARLCHVGPDYRRNGRTAGGMMALLLAGRSGQIAVFGGSGGIQGHRQRIQGFQETVGLRHPGARFLDPLFVEDDDIIAYEKASRCFASHPDIAGIYIAAAGTYGVCRAAENAAWAVPPVILCSDLVPASADLMRSGLIQAAVCQQPFVQGYESVRRAFNHLLTGGAGEDLFVEDQILIAENANPYL